MGHIIVTSTRDIDGQHHDLGTYVKNVGQALESLVIYELGYGGRITELSATRAVVKTTVMNCLDTTIFEGSEEDMAPLVHVSALAAKHHGFQDERSKQEALDAVMAFTKGNPLLIKLGGDLIIGQYTVRRASAVH